ncbi:cupin domain-containing protein [Cohnella nanjingensis]|uniref:Cupin domain-containing protein n=1 Tax=Cohnella nanjingensis TaxID=1387779 RepID=A0A7X0VGW5_9BACL|nr:cupin domain-containing protein [Cohnella nanjingensis]MBB6672054.1 cupin domain-containing protein [Cohnella nanjingensis]
MNPDLMSPSLTLMADSNEVVNYKRDPHNYITQLFAAQFPPIQNGFFNVRLSRGIIVQPHWHTNVTELVFVISGEAVTSVFNPFTQRLMTYRLGPGQVAQFPKGWFHWIVALSDEAQLLTIFDQPTPDVVYGSDFLRFLPKEIAGRAYCVDEAAYAEAVAPIRESVILGPPPGCMQREEDQYAARQMPPYPGLHPFQPPYSAYYPHMQPEPYPTQPQMPYPEFGFL